MDLEIVLDNISIARAFSTYHQKDILVEAVVLMAAYRHSFIIADSFQECGKFADRQAYRARYLRHLLKLVDEFGVVVVMTN
uniref:Rad51 domain-containing protein n=1 Tax=Strongyloides papillosus TaxID=174720 RepID=A0A0N5BUG4_STREA